MSNELLDTDAAMRGYPRWVRHSVDIATTVDGIRGRMETTTVVRGEIQGLRTFANPPRVTFDLARPDDDSGFIALPVWIPAHEYRNIARYLEKLTGDSAGVLARRGSQIAVTGTLTLRPGATTVQLVATRVYPLSDAPGPIETARITAFASVHGRDSKKYADAAAGVGHKHDSAEEFANMWQGNPPQNIVMLTSRGSSVAQDLRGVLQGANLARGVAVEHVRIRPGADGIVDTVAALQADQARSADLVVIVRGGGGWRDFAVFDDLRVADAIIEATGVVPVATALGHHGDVSLADIVATTSLATPSVLADAIATTYDVRARQASRRARSANAWAGTTDARPSNSEINAETGGDRGAVPHELPRREGAARLRAELDNVRRCLATERNRSIWWSTQHHSDLRRVALSRIRVRSVWCASAGWAITGALLLWLIMSWHGAWPPHKHTWVLAACLGIAVASSIFVSRAGKRALKPLRVASPRNVVYANVDAWLADARAVRSPRQYRRTLLQDLPRDR